MSSDLPPDLVSVTPMLQARDLQETIAFYTNVLHFEVESTAADEEGSVNWCTLASGGSRVMFYSGDRDAEPPVMTGELYFFHNDVKRLWEELENRVHIEHPLRIMIYGMREFAIKDCNGYTLSFGQPAS